ncbi:MAG: hypothetical protein GEU79_10575, partial [Acidimicrobiia bacterium]|nr:hypothetical protein [Acidimicrobiia bacterium]
MRDRRARRSPPRHRPAPGRLVPSPRRRCRQRRPSPAGRSSCPGPPRRQPQRTGPRSRFASAVTLRSGV